MSGPYEVRIDGLTASDWDAVLEELKDVSVYQLIRSIAGNAGPLIDQQLRLSYNAVNNAFHVQRHHFLRG